MLVSPSCHQGSAVSDGQSRNARSEIQACSRSLFTATRPSSPACAAGLSIRPSMRIENDLKFLGSSISTVLLCATMRMIMARFLLSNLVGAKVGKTARAGCCRYHCLVGDRMSILIRGGTVINHDHSRRADVLVDGDTVAVIGPSIEAPAGAEVIAAGGCYVMPGGIDPHTHLEMPFMGTVTADDFEWGTKAALAGGTTMVVDFCLPDPGQSMLAAYQDWRRKSERAASDYGFHMAVTSWSKQVFDEMEIVVKTYGINTFKHFMAYKGALMVNDDELYNSFARCAHLGAMPLVHAENGDVVARMQEALMARGVSGPEGHAYSRPPEVEGEATNRAIMIADMTGAPLYVVHTSCREAHEAIARARANGKRVYGEPLIQHLLLDATEYSNKDWDYAARRVMSPPFRAKAHQDSLWAGLQSGSL